MNKISPSYYESNLFSRKWRSNLAAMVKELLPDHWELFELLDVGVGDGYTIRLVKPVGPVTGIDFEPEAVAGATSRGVNASLGSAYRIPHASESFDIVTCLEVLEHLEDPSRSLNEIFRVLRPDGFLVATTPVPNIRWRILWWLWTKLGPGKKWKNIPHVSDLHIGDKASDEGGLVEMLERVGFVTLRTSSCNYGMVAGLLARKRPPP